MKQRFLLCFLITTFAINNSIAQSKSGVSNNQPYTNAYFGIGLGLEYGGIGIQGEYLPSKYVGIFAGAGYNFLDPAFNLGVSAKLLPDNRFCPTLSIMYGYNAVLKMKNFMGGVMTDSKSYYGTTIGAGAELKSRKNNKGKLSFGIRVPARSEEFKDKYKKLKDAGYEFKPDILPVTFSIGYHWAIGEKKIK